MVNNKILNWLKSSNRYKHLIGGFIIGLLAFSDYNAVYASSIGGFCLELKDKLRGSYFDVIDFSLVIIGAILGRLTIRLIF